MQTPSYRQPEIAEAAATPSEVRQVLLAIAREISLESVELPNEFFPSHVSVALVNAVFRSPLRDRGATPSVAGRYCRHFGIPSVRARSWEPLPVDEQETLGDLIGRFDELGVDRMATEVFRTAPGSAEATIRKAENILRAAEVLRHMRIDVLQDVPARRPDAIDDALRRLPGIGEGTIRRFLMYTGEDTFVRGDTRVRKFVSSALFRRVVSAERAEELVRNCAHEMLLSPRFLDCQIWKLGVV